MPPPGVTSTGSVFEHTVLPALKQGGYSWEKPRAPIGRRPGGGRHFVDLVVWNVDGARILVSLKWQQKSGTAEQKVPFEVISLAEALQNDPNSFSHAYLVLGGPGWTLRDFYTGGGLNRYLKGCEKVTIVDMESFLARANDGRL